MLFDPELKETFKERSQLHRILVDNTWIFGEEFALTVDDQSLTEVLRAHAKAAKLKVLINEPVKRPGGRKGIIDLMLSRRVPTNQEAELAHLVVELKAPSVTATAKETGQIKSYAYAVQEDQRFRGVATRWSFWLVVNDMDSYVQRETHIKEKPQGLLWESPDLNMPSRVWVKTWGQIIQDCRTRLKIFQQALNLKADKDVGLEYLKKTYARILLGTDTTDTVPESEQTTESKETAVEPASTEAQ
jgi:hypothetical protein